MIDKIKVMGTLKEFSYNNLIWLREHDSNAFCKVEAIIKHISKLVEVEKWKKNVD